MQLMTDTGRAVTVVLLHAREVGLYIRQVDCSSGLQGYIGGARRMSTLDRYVQGVADSYAQHEIACSNQLQAKRLVARSYRRIGTYPVAASHYHMEIIVKKSTKYKKTKGIWCIVGRESQSWGEACASEQMQG